MPFGVERFSSSLEAFERSAAPTVLGTADDDGWGKSSCSLGRSGRASFSVSHAAAGVDDALAEAREEMEAMELMQLLQAQEAARGLAHAAMASVSVARTCAKHTSTTRGPDTPACGRERFKSPGTSNLLVLVGDG
jgi:hypothetical protein